MKIRFLLLALLLSAAFASRAQRPVQQLYIANDDHTDYMWTADESQYRAAFLHMLDYYLDQTDKTAALPSPFQSRFNLDGSFWLWEYERNKTPQEFQRLIAQIKSGHISVPYNALVSCYGAMPTEAVLRGMYYAGSLERTYGLELDQAVAMENQTQPLGLGSLWAGSGVKYSWKGVCNCATKVKGLTTRDKEIYWYKGLDSSAVLMKWYAIAPGGNKELGGYAEARDPALAVEQLTRLCQSPRHPYRIAGAFGYGWDDLQTTTDVFTATAQQKSNAEREVIVSNQSDFFRAFEAAYGQTLSGETLSYGNEWDLYSASLTEVSAKVKRSVEKLRAAEALASLVSARVPGFAQDLAGMKQEAWMALGLYYEHDWTADGPVTREAREAWQRKIEQQLSIYVDSLHARSQQKLGELITRKGSRTRFYAFNPLSWQRTDVSDFPYAGPTNVKVVDTQTRKEVPAQVIRKDGEQYIRILAADIPSMGYKVYELRPGKAKPFSNAVTYGGNFLENEFFKVTLTNQGVITSLLDKRNGNRELAADVNGRFMNDLGAGADNTGTIAVEQAGPVSVTVACTGQTPLAHTSRITLYRDVPRVDIHNQITQNFGEVHSWAFSHALPAAEVWHEELGAILKAKPASQGGHYATRNARLDWLTLNHFAALTQGAYALTLSNADCAFLKLGTSAQTFLDTQTPQVSVLAGGQVDGPGLGILNQGGDSHFTQRFALGTHQAYDPASSMRFALEHQNPLVAGVVTGTQPYYPEKQYSFLTISDPRIVVWSLKPAEEGAGEGLIARLWNFGHQPAQVRLSVASGIASARHTTHLETDRGAARVVNGQVEEQIGQQQINTFRLLLRKEQ